MNLFPHHVLDWNLFLSLLWCVFILVYAGLARSYLLIASSGILLFVKKKKEFFSTNNLLAMLKQFSVNTFDFENIK